MSTASRKKLQKLFTRFSISNMVHAMLHAFLSRISSALNKKNIPNIITFGRIAMVLVLALIVVFRPGFSELIFWLFAVAALSDYLDGYLARRWKATSAFGAMMDQISDKLLVVLMLVYLLKYDIGGMLVLPALVIILREVYVSGLREFMALKKVPMPVSKTGKWKTATQLAAIGALLWGVAYSMRDVQAIGGILLLVSAFLAAYSAVEYTKRVAGKIS